ncbi:fatty acid synthase [Bicyclus anynana]|uniref:Fatty acid synthase n=1 Tax=Bicyclus anynana TaxID=110368 RepID=A0ABM3LJH9_BICAN|nr:fatty acid synthase [Bicyclus anynana]
MTPTPNAFPQEMMRRKEERSGERSPAADLPGDRIVISGMSGLYPECHSVKDLSDILYNKINPINNDKSRWEFEHPEVSQYSGKVPGLELFDAQFFKVHYRLSHNMDPMSRKLIEQAYQAIYDAGVCIEDVFGKKVGVFIGSSILETEKLGFYHANDKTGTSIPGCSRSMFANRISYWLNAKGPSLGIDAGTCSSTQALEQAYLAIKSGQCEAAIVGGGFLCMHPHTSMHFGRVIKLNTDDKIKSFDTEAAGCAMSEAVNVLFLQKAKDALRIYAEVVHVKCIYTSSLQDETKGQKYSFYRDPEDMADFLNTFYQEIQIPPQVVEYVEAFGLGELKTDKAELEAIEKVFCNNRKSTLLVGSVMSNIGYTESASGISNITKVLLGYHNGLLAGNLNCESPRNDISALRDGRMRILTDHQSFGRSYTAVNGLSVGGVNAHVLLDGHYKAKDPTRYKTKIPHLVVISGRQESSVEKILEDLKSRSVDPEEIALLHNIHKTRISGHLGRGYIVLDTNGNDETICLSERLDDFDDAKRPLWFVYSGMGSQWAGMGATLMRIPIFAAAIEKCRQALEPKGVNIVHIITSPDKTIFDNILNSFVGIAAIQIGLTDVLRALGILPDKIIGHSVGELGCAYADGCFTAEEMILSAYSRGLVSVQTPFIRGSMAAVGVGFEQISKMCPPEIEVACHNSPNSSTISGPVDIMKGFLEKLTAKGIFAKEVSCSNIAFHSRYIADAGPGLLKYLSEVISSPKERSERWVSTSVSREKWNDPIAKYCSAEYHTNNLLNAVLFEETSRLIPANAVVVEIAPHGLLQAILKRSLPESCKLMTLTRRGHPDNALLLLEAIGNLYMEGYNPQVQVLYPKVEFPVSTGTPMLSHLVEWAHHEKWNVTLFTSPHIKIASSCNYVISIHDDAHCYLKGHVIRETNLYPFAATLVAVWDTLAMFLGVPKKQLSVQFHDVHLHSQPVLHEQRQLRLFISLQNSGRFQVLNENIKVATGYIISEIDKATPLEEKLHSKTDFALKSKNIYELLEVRDYNYSNEFRSIHNANLSLTEAHLLWKENWVTLIDGIIQLNAFRRGHESVSQLHFIKKIVIDVKKHNDTIVTDDAHVLSAKVHDDFNSTRCGGVIIENMKYYDLPSITKEHISLKTLKFVPNITCNKIDEKGALYVFLQIVAENLNKRVINIANVINNNAQAKHKDVQIIIHDIPDLKINLLQISQNDLIKKNDTYFNDIDTLLITDLAADDSIWKVLHRLLRPDTLLINKEEYMNSLTIHSSLPYRSVCAHTIGSSRLELVLWRPSDVAINTSAVTVFSQADLTKISAQLSKLPPNHRLVIFTSYPAFSGLKDTFKEWRDKDCCKVNLVISNHKSFDEQSLNQLPFTDLAVNYLNDGIWGGEYYLPIQGNIVRGKELALQTSSLDDINFTRWIEVSQSHQQENSVKVHYVGLNDAYIKKVLGSTARENNARKRLVEYDFSGITERGERVMGIVQEESVKGLVQAKPELLWPVPEYWTLEEAATVPLAYCLAFYCLYFKSRLYHGNSVFVHSGAGALGQAIISIALAHDCDVYTTVSSSKKKMFLLTLFPELKEDQIGFSRDIAFKYMVLNKTNGIGCDIVITSVKGDLRDASIDCCKVAGFVVDISLLLDNEDYSFSTFCLHKIFTYTTQQFSSLFDPTYVKELNKLQLMVSEGIALGYVRPLSRVTYAAEHASRALRLQAGGRHVGRVLLDLTADVSCVQQKITCSADRLQLLLSENDVLGIQLADRLISRGARNLHLHCTEESSGLLFRVKFWEDLGVHCTISYGKIWDKNILNLLNSNTLQKVEGLFCILNLHADNEDLTLLESVNLAAQKSNGYLKYFAVIDVGKEHNVTRKLTTPFYQFIYIKLSSLKTMENKEYFLITCAIDAIEQALCHKQRVIIAHRINKPKNNILQKIADLADFSVPNIMLPEVTLKDMGMDLSKSQIVRAYLRDAYYISLEESDIPIITAKQLWQLDDNKVQCEFAETEGLKTFISDIHCNELLANQDMLSIPTLTSNNSLSFGQFDQNATYLCIVPGVEGLHVRFREMCERLKVPAIVLQPTVDRPHETIKEMAHKNVQILQRMVQLKKRFYLLGYESGVLVALEMAAILEDQGLTGTIFCIGGGPDEVLHEIVEKLSKFETEELLQVAIAHHIFKLMVNDENPEDLNLESELKNISTWKEKVSFCVQKLLGRIDHSIQYAKEYIEAVYARLVQVRRYHSEPSPLRSLLISIRPWSRTNESNSIPIQSYSQQKVVEYELQVPLAHAAHDMRCAAIVNRHLDKDILEEFDNNNLCETYTVSNLDCLSSVDMDINNI